MSIYSYHYILLLLLAIGCSNSADDLKDTEEAFIKEVSIRIDATQKKHTINPMVQGFGLIYCFEKDELYADGKMVQLFKDVGAGYLRYPGGAVTTMYHWNDLNGQGWIDHWNGTYDRTSDVESLAYMDLNEYMQLCNTSGVEPMLGINMSSGRNYDRQEDGLNEAIELLKYCNEKGFEVNYLYLDNENHHKKWTAEEYAAQINYYVPAIKEQMPNAKLIANWTDKFRTNTGSFTTLVNQAGDNFDYIDVHWYWKWENGSWDEWTNKTPMENETKWYDGGTYVEEIEYFNQLMASLGKPHIKLASMEWNLGPGKYKSDSEHTHFRTALMQAEMQMQMMQGGLEIASLWSTQWPDDAESDFRFLVSSSNNYQPTPTAQFYKLYKHALNGDLVFSVSEDKRIMCTAVVQNNEKAFVYLLNKNDEDVNISLLLEGYDVSEAIQIVSFVEPGVLEPFETTMDKGKSRITLPQYSLTMIEMQLN